MQLIKVVSIITCFSVFGMFYFVLVQYEPFHLVTKEVNLYCYINNSYYLLLLLYTVLLYCYL